MKLTFKKGPSLNYTDVLPVCQNAFQNTLKCHWCPSSSVTFCHRGKQIRKYTNPHCQLHRTAKGTNVGFSVAAEFETQVKKCI